VFNTAPITEPFALVFSIFETRLEIARVVEVALVVVELSPVKFCKVEEAELRNPPVRVERPVTDKFASVPTEVREDAVTPAARVFPVKLAAATEPAEPETFPVKLPVPEVKKRLVELAVVAKKFVVVAAVVVDRVIRSKI
jgi:hypothetical protein